jgi:hypothetical protein
MGFASAGKEGYLSLAAACVPEWSNKARSFKTPSHTKFASGSQMPLLKLRHGTRSCVRIGIPPHIEAGTAPGRITDRCAKVLTGVQRMYVLTCCDVWCRCAALARVDGGSCARGTQNSAEAPRGVARCGLSAPNPGFRQSQCRRIFTFTMAVAQDSMLATPKPSNVSLAP